MTRSLSFAVRWEKTRVASIVVRPRGPFTCNIRVPGDKSISHRALILAALSDGPCEIHGLLEAEDCLSTVHCLRALAVRCERLRPEHWLVEGRGLGGWQASSDPLDVGNAGTALSLLTGVLAAHPFRSTLTGDQSIRRRPQKRLAEPLSQMGASIEGVGEQCLPPLTITGASLAPICYQPPQPSAQVKSAVLLAALHAAGETTVVEPTPTRDHTERMLRLFGVPVQISGTQVGVRGPAPLAATPVAVPGDVSAAAFFLVAAAVIPGSRVTVRDVGVNPSRTGILDVLTRMGASVGVENVRQPTSEPIGDVTVAAPDRLQAVEIGGDLVPRMIDEIPVACVAACFAEGNTVVRDAPQLRHKESDRIAAVTSQLRRLGADISPTEDGLVVIGGEGLTGGACDSLGDHRIAMTCAIAGLAASGPVEVRDTDCIATSFPGFESVLASL